MSGPQTSFTSDRQAVVDAIVERAAAAARAFRALDQQAVDRIVLAMVKAGLHAATEFLYDYLKDKRSVGVIDHDDERDIDLFAEPIGVVMAITPITNPTSTVLFKAIVAAKTRNAVLFRPSPYAVRSAQRTVAILAAAAEAAGMPPRGAAGDPGRRA